MIKAKGNFKKEWDKLKEQLAPMSWKERIDHLWTYYKEYLWVAAVVVILVAAMISSAINLSKDILVTGMMVNLTIEQRGYNYLSEDYAEKIQADPTWEVVKLEYTVFDPLSDQANSEQNYYAAMTVVAEVSAQKLDYLLLDKAGMEFYIGQDVYMDLREFFTEEELAAFEKEDRLIYAQEEGVDHKWVAAVDITDTAFIRDNVTSEGPIYFALSGSTQHKETCRDMWEHINGWQSPQ